MANSFIAIANSIGDTFSNVMENDLIFFASEPARLMMGTQSNLPAQLQIGSNNIIFNDFVTFASNVKVDGSMSIDSNMSMNGSILFNSNMMVLGPVTMCNDVQVLGTLSTGKGMILNGDQFVSGGASYCNGDIYFTTYTSNEELRDQRVFIRSYYGTPSININQLQSPSNPPLLLFQTSNAEGYVTNNNTLNLLSHSNIRLGSSNNIHITLSNTGHVGIGTSNPRAKLDVYSGNINAGNFARLCKSTDTSNALNININWQNALSGGEHTLYFETTQHLNGGTRVQKHRLSLSNPFSLTSYVAKGYGDVSPFTSLYIGTANLSSSNVRVSSTVSGFLAGNVRHELDLNMLTVSSDIGHTWLT